MNASTTERWQDDPRSTAELLVLARREWREDEANPQESFWWETGYILMWRATPEVFQAAERWCGSADPLDRRLGLSILRSIGQETGAFRAEAVALLISLLSDVDSSVIAGAAYALGERNDPLAIPHLLPLLGHPDPEVRGGVTHGLSSHDDPRAIAGLIELSRDVEQEVRDWATFNLGTMTQVDTADLREALLARVMDEDPETRGEALIGLANRYDERTVATILRELERYAKDGNGWWAVEAAGTLGLPVFHAYLLPLRTLIEQHPWFLDDYEEALTACRPSPDA